MSRKTTRTAARSPLWSLATPVAALYALITGFAKTISSLATIQEKGPTAFLLIKEVVWSTGVFAIYMYLAFVLVGIVIFAIFGEQRFGKVQMPLLALCAVLGGYLTVQYPGGLFRSVTLAVITNTVGVIVLLIASVIGWVIYVLVTKRHIHGVPLTNFEALGSFTFSDLWQLAAGQKPRA